MTTHCPKCKAENPDDSKFCKECGLQIDSFDKMPAPPTQTLEAPKEELTTGSTFAGRYQIIEELGKGGMGKVYKVHDTKIKEKIALKLIKPEIAKDKKTIERFSNELKFARKIRHKNICQMFDLGEDQGTHFITMEFVEGQDLKKLIRQTGQLAIGTTINIAKQVCDGLAEAHSSGVIHRDLKPSNIMIDADGSARIMDFGIARSIDGKGITGAGVMIGTPEYMSPEQVEGKEVDHRSDIYSLGVILYEMVTGRVPFEGDTPFTVGVKHKSEFPQNPKELNSQISDDLNNVILRCLDKDKEQRYQKVEDVCSELEGIEKGIPTTERIVPERKPLTSREITVQFSMKKLLIPALVILAVIIGGVILWSPWSKEATVVASSDKPSLAVLYFRNGSGDANLDHWKETLCDYLITDLSQSKYIHVLNFSQVVSLLEKHNLLESTRYSAENLKSVAAAGGASHILTGSFSKAGESFRIDYSLHDYKKGGEVASDRVEGRGEDSIFSMVDELTIKVKNNLKLTEQQISSDYDKDLGEITTSSQEAYRYYRDGRELFLKGLPKESIPLLEKAISIDPDFAMAYRSIGSAYNNVYLGGGGRENQKKGFEYLKKALEIAEASDRISHKEKLIIQGNFFAVVEGNYQKAGEIFDKLVADYPEDQATNVFMGWHSYVTRDWDNVIKYFGLAIKQGQESRITIYQLGQTYCAKGLYEKAREIYRGYIDNVEDDAMVHRYIANSFLYEGKYQEALEEADMAIALNPNIYSKGVIYHLKGDFEVAEKDYKSWLEREGIGWNMNSRRYREFLYRMLGQYEKAKNVAKEGLDFAEKDNRMYWKRVFYALLAEYDLAANDLDSVVEKAEFIWEFGVKFDNPSLQINALWRKIQVHLKRNNIEKALALAEEVKEICESTPSRIDERWYLDNLGLIEMKKENYPKAIDLFTQVYDLQGGQRGWIQPHAYILTNLASAYYLNGDLEKAKKEYERILTLTTGRLREGDLYAKSFYKLGVIHEEQNNKTEAITYYEKFLDLWKDADPGIAEVVDARERLSALRIQ